MNTPTQMDGRSLLGGGHVRHKLTSTRSSAAARGRIVVVGGTRVDASLDVDRGVSLRESKRPSPAWMDASGLTACAAYASAEDLLDRLTNK